MAEAREIEDPGSKFSAVLNAAARMPGVRINRSAYLRAALMRHCTAEQIEQAVVESPAAAGISRQVLDNVANTSIGSETTKVAAISALTGIPGGLAMIGTIPADTLQYVGHMLRVSQKLAYVYSWPDLFAGDGEEMDEATEGILTLFVGVMFGVQAAQGGVTKISAMIAAQLAKNLPKQALTKGVIYPAVKKVATALGAKMTVQIFANGVAKIVPIVGAVVSGGLSLATFLPMTKRLQKHLASLELTKPGIRPAENETNEEPLEDELV